MSGIKMRRVAWRSSAFRPAVLPAVKCPTVKDWDGHPCAAWLGITHCNACAFCKSLTIDYETRTGTVGCSVAVDDGA